jgi:hypothetical protein
LPKEMVSPSCGGWPLPAELAAEALPESSSSGFDAGIQGLTYSGGCQPPCWALPFSSSCIYLAFTMTSVRVRPAAAYVPPTGSF